MTDSSSSDGEAIPAPEGPANIIETDYEIGQNNVQPFGLDIHNPVFAISGLSVVAFVIITLAFQNSIGPVFTSLRDFLTSTFDWFFLLAGNIFVLVCLALIVTPLGKVRIGGRDATPDYGYAGWFAMLFAAGMGIGLMFYGVSEPISHYSTSFGGIAVGENGMRTDWAPLGGAEGDEAAAHALGMAATIFHWGLHPWAIYAVVALSLALFAYNKGLPLTVRSMFYPIFGERVWGWPGHVIDILAVFATLFGLATSLGVGAQQANAGLNYLFGIEIGTTSQIVLIALITGAALVSVLRGLDGGVKVLSEVNLIMAAVLVLFILFAGPTTTLFGDLAENIGAYATELVPLSNPFGREDTNFSQGWTAFYWAWWISWSPFVGMFIARVSRGRTVREFVTCVLIIPTAVSILWMTVLGGTALDQLIHQGFTGAQDAALELKLFEMLTQLPWTWIASLLSIVLVIVFFVTSSDSGSLVIDTITAGGKVDAPVAQRVFWATFEGLVAIALLIGGGLGALQAMAVSTGFPFAIVLLIACYALIKGLMDEPRQ
ncbi:BCCT family transporter [Pararhodobacter sp. CCB-MM2]|uniref:BCCT family transporter n=1 Tax=Pararhodobacter sp. CCB-MM2 TaxID=1786003 RepID=UPI00082F2A2F|nr:BCCT family transporter [Pararhodobacter sp. CCB-MM2]